MSDQTLKVKPWGKGQGDFVVIDKAAFDENFHVLLDAKEAAKEGTAADIKSKLDALGVEYKANASKSELQALLDKAIESVQIEEAKAALTEKGVSLTGEEPLADLKALLAAQE